MQAAKIIAFLFFHNLKKYGSFVLWLLIHSTTNAQCPQNIDFEDGSFNNWTCYVGSVTTVGNQNIKNLNAVSTPQTDRHTMMGAVSGQIDYFGGFPVACPNGSGYSIKLGNNTGGAEAEAVSYEFTIPANRNTYSITYYYAVVFQDPSHEVYQQPSLEIEAKNISDNVMIDCSSFSFIPNGSSLPGFVLSPIQQDTTNVWCKNWTPVSINLNNKAGKTIRLTFKTSDCTFRKHFGYAYIDVNTACDSQFEGAAFCTGDTTVTLTAPYGYQNYTWYNQNFTNQLGTQSQLIFTPPPLSGTTVAVEVTPFFGYGCVDTFYAKLMDTLTIRPNAGRDTFVCNDGAATIGENPKPGLTYRWSPGTGLSDSTKANPRASPTTNTTYTLTVRSAGGGCVATDVVFVESFIIDTSVAFVGKQLFCSVGNDSAVLSVQTLGRVQWYRNNVPITGANSTRYKVTQSGSYFAEISNAKGCTSRTPARQITIELPILGIRYPIVNAVKNMPIPLQARNIGSIVSWSPTTYLSMPTTYAPTFTSTQDALYTILLTTEAGCKTIDTQQVRIFAYMDIYVPTAFTPNNDGTNDYMLPIASGFKRINYFKVFNRWGQEVYDLRQNENGWNGLYKNQPQPVGTYVWMVEGYGADNKIYKKKGTVVLIR